MLPDGLLLPPGTRLIHVGSHKTGTSAVQGAFELARDRLPEHGVSYYGAAPGRTYLEGALAVTGRKPQLGKQVPDLSEWTALTRAVAAEGDRRVLVSSAFFGDGDTEATSRVVEGFSGDWPVHFVITLRPLTKIMASQWQQFVQNGHTRRYEDWLDGVLNRPPGEQPTPLFWHRHRHDRLVGRWAEAAGADRVTVVIVDESDRMMVLRTFEAMLGLPGGLLVPDAATTNRSLSLAEAELIRLLNEEAKRRKWPEQVYARLVRSGAINHLKRGYQPGPGDQRIVTPPWALKQIAEIGAEIAAGISSLGVRVIGDVSSLGATPAGIADKGPDLPVEVPGIPPPAAAQAVLGVILASKLPDHVSAGRSWPTDQAARTEDRPVREVDAKTLVRVLAGRGRRRVRRALRRPGR
ncbi:MAG: hypothetical protein J2P32_13660 [Actinobacteria bacterium]|nr:hypothetical protein [Actinomycetota bacterium]